MKQGGYLRFKSDRILANVSKRECRYWLLKYRSVIVGYVLNSLVWESLLTSWTHRPSTVKKKDQLQVADAPDVLGFGGYPDVLSPQTLSYAAQPLFQSQYWESIKIIIKK